MLRKLLDGKKSMLIEVPFFNKAPVHFEQGLVIEYFDKNNKPVTSEPEIRLVRRYSVDSLTGMINGNVEYFEYKKGKVNPLGIALLKIDDTNRNYFNVLEPPKDSIGYSSFYLINNDKYPAMMLSDMYDNGVIRTKNIDDTRLIYYPNGRIQAEVISIEKGKEKTNNIYEWFDNGQLALIKILVKKENDYLEKIMAVWDTLGKQLVVNGNGLGMFYYEKNKQIYVESGLIKDSLKEGKWVAKNSIGTVDYEEIYKNGVFIEGKSFEGNQVFPYKVAQNADYKGGISLLANFLRKNLSYPIYAQKNKVRGKVYVQFVVCTDGTLCDYKVLKGIGFGCDEEALRVIMLSSGKWGAAMKRGKPVRSKLVIPINFEIAD
jgi:hypothetical protein